MKTADEILHDAMKAEQKEPLEGHVRTIATLREKDYSWREIADFLNERGVPTNHSKVFRFFKKNKGGNMTTIPTKDQYIKALLTIKSTTTENQIKMLVFHYKAHNRTVTFSQLAEIAGFKDHKGANLQYGFFGKALGNEMGFTFAVDEKRNEPFYSSSIGTGIDQPKDIEFQFMMHHELADALRELGWFEG